MITPRLIAALSALAVQNVCLSAEPLPSSSGDPTVPSPVAAASASRPVSLAFTPYVWLTSINGTTGARGVSADVDASFLDILQKSDSVIGLMGALDLEIERFVLQANGAFTKARMPEQRGRAINGPRGGGGTVAAQVEASAKSLWVEGFAGYRLLDTQRTAQTPARFTLDGFAGFRVTDMELDLDVTASANATLPTGEVLQGGVQRGISDGATWVEPFVGLRGAFELHENWIFSLRADVGGFGVDDSDFSWQVVGALGYRWRRDQWTYSVFAGYRALGQDYSTPQFTWDAVTHGPMMGMQFAYRF